MFSFPAPGPLGGFPPTAPATRQTSFSVWKTKNDTEESPHNPACWHNQTTHTASMISRACPHTLSPIFRNLSLGLCNYKCPET